MIDRLFCFKVFVNRINHRGVKFFAAETVSAADNGCFATCFVKSSDNVEVKRLAESTSFFGSVHNCDTFYGCGDSVYEIFYGERAVKSYFQKTYFLTLFGEIVYGFFDSFAAGTHHNDKIGSVGSAVVLINLVLSAGKCADFFHHFRNDCRSSVVVFVGSFSVLEVNIRVLSGTHLVRMLWIKGSCLKFLDIFHYS